VQEQGQEQQRQEQEQNLQLLELVPLLGMVVLAWGRQWQPQAVKLQLLVPYCLHPHRRLQPSMGQVQ
jgi:hypothetical protein